MKKSFAIIAIALTGMTACQSTTDKLAEAASQKNIDLRGYLMYGKVETNDAETATPQGTLIIGDCSYKSRKVGIPSNQKVPNAANYKCVKRTTLFGTSEHTTEWDYTPASPDEAKIIQSALAALTEKDNADTAVAGQ